MVRRAGNDTISSAEERTRWWHLTCVLKRRLHINFISRDRQRAEAGEFLAGTVYLQGGLICLWARQCDILSALLKALKPALQPSLSYSLRGPRALRLTF